MFPYSTIITYGELKEWLNDFSDLVVDKVFTVPVAIQTARHSDFRRV